MEGSTRRALGTTTMRRTAGGCLALAEEEEEGGEEGGAEGGAEEEEEAGGEGLTITTMTTKSRGAGKRRSWVRETGICPPTTRIST